MAPWHCSANPLAPSVRSSDDDYPGFLSVSVAGSVLGVAATAANASESSGGRNWAAPATASPGALPAATLSHFVHRPTDGYGGWDATARVPFYVFGAWAMTRGAVAL